MRKKMNKHMMILVLNLLTAGIARAETLVFVSFSLPDETLKSYSKEAKKSDARLIMRGLKGGSFLKTKQEADRLGISFDLDPTLFEKYDVQVVPTFVNVSGENTTKLEGHITWAKAQDQVRDQSRERAEALGQERRGVR